MAYRTNNNLSHEEKKELITSKLKDGWSLERIGLKLSVSKQRVYQMMTQYSIPTPEKKKKGYWKEQDDRLKWLQRILCSRGVDVKEREAIIDEYQKDLNKYLPKYCPVLGVELVYGATGARVEYSASVDQFNASQGYTFDNINVISWKANRIKNDGTLEDLTKIVAWMQQRSTT